MQAQLIMPLRTLRQVNPPNWVKWLFIFGVPLLMTGFQFWRLVFWELLGVMWVVMWLAYRIPLTKLILCLPFENSIKKSLTEEARQALLAFIGQQPRYIDVGFSWINRKACGTGIAYHDGQIYMMQRGEAARVTWDKVRSWSWEVPGYDRIINTALAIPGNGTLGTATANLRASAEAALNSGFFVEIADIGHPVWQFTTSDVEVLRKWDEIFNQLKENEGRLPA